MASRKKHRNPFDDTVQSYFGRDHLDTKGGDIGIEIETEGKIVRSEKPPFFWTEHEEHSIRGGTEFVLRNPVPARLLKDAMEEITSHTAKCQFNDNSPRTSVHIHVNVTDLTIRQVYSVLMLYWAFENILVHMNGPDREGNLFCQRLQDAEGIIDTLKGYFKNRMFIPKDLDGRYRYAALNLSSMSKFGSLEFRFIRGLTDFEEVELWAQTLHDFVHKAKEFSWADITKLLIEDKGATHLRTVGLFFNEPFMKLMRDRVRPDFILQAMQENLDLIHMFHKTLRGYDTKPLVGAFGQEDDESEDYDRGRDLDDFDPDQDARDWDNAVPRAPRPRFDPLARPVRVPREARVRIFQAEQAIQAEHIAIEVPAQAPDPGPDLDRIREQFHQMQWGNIPEREE